MMMSAVTEAPLPKKLSEFPVSGKWMKAGCVSGCVGGNLVVVELLIGHMVISDPVGTKVCSVFLGRRRTAPTKLHTE